MPVVLTFEKAGDVSVELAVAKMGAKSMHGDHKDNGMHDHGHDHMDHKKN